MKKYIVVLGKTVLTNFQVRPEPGSTDDEIIADVREKPVNAYGFLNYEIAKKVADRLGGVAVPYTVDKSYE